MVIGVNIRAARILYRMWAGLLLHSLFVVVVNFALDYLAIDLSLSGVISMIGIVLSILMGFRISSAYDRWWEARKIWGDVVNTSRSFAGQLIAFTHQSGLPRKHLESIIYRQIAIVYAMGYSLRQQRYTAIIKPFLAEDEHRQLLGKQNLPNLLLLHHLYAVKLLEKDGQLTNFEMLRLSDMISHLTASFGASERIKNTPFPLPYSYFTSILVHLFALMVPFGMAELGLLTVPVSIAVIFIFLAIEQIAIEIQDPFANRENDIPVIALSKIIEIDLKEMLGDIVLPSRRQPRDGILM